MINAIDHVVISTTDLATDCGSYAAIFEATPFMETLDGQLSSALFQSENIGVKLVASDGTQGLTELVFRCGDKAAMGRRLTRLGLAAANTPESGEVVESKIDYLPIEKSRGLSIGIASVATTSTRSSDGHSPSALGLDHIVIATDHPEHTAFLFAAQLGLDLRMDLSNPNWNSRLMFFRCGDAIVEIYSALETDKPNDKDRFFGLTWRVADIAATRERLLSCGLEVSNIRKGRKPKTAVFTLKTGTAQVPTLFIGPAEAL